jgi:hypothetical protein
MVILCEIGQNYEIINKKRITFWALFPWIDEQHSPVTYNFTFLTELEPNGLRFYLMDNG